MEKRKRFDILQTVVPKILRIEILNQLHDTKSAGHLGREKTLGKVRTRYYWPGMTSDVSCWCQTCVPCQRRKPGPGFDKSPMKREPVYRPLQCVAVDIMGPLYITDKSNQYNGGRRLFYEVDRGLSSSRPHGTDRHKLVCEFICRYGSPLRIHTENLQCRIKKQRRYHKR